MQFVNSGIASQRSVIRAFSLVELMVVIGIITLLIGLLLPVLTKVHKQADGAKCLSNLHQIGIAMLIYCDGNRGQFVPLGPLMDGQQDTDDAPRLDPEDATQFLYKTLGSEVAPWQRWPTAVLPGHYAAVPAENDWPLYMGSDDADGLKAGPWSSPVMLCPADPQPCAAHSYLLNFHLVENPRKVTKYATAAPNGRSAAEVVVLGEKRSQFADYYMEKADFPVAADAYANATLKVDLYRHGIKLGSNYLFKDMHAANTPPQAIRAELDPWDL
jgi:type II secretory pathway pseudopilin PulG